MICVSVLYPSTPGKKFDHRYYAEKHFALVRDRLQGFGLIRDEIDKGVGGAEPGSAAPYVAIGRLYFKTIADFEAAFNAHNAELLGDVPNYTDIPPQIQISQVV